MTQPNEAEQAESTVTALVDQQSVDCSDCGKTIDLSDATDPVSVVVALEQHRQTHEDSDQ